MITDVDDYFTKGCGRCAKFDTPACNALRWLPVQLPLRDVCLDLQLEETAKWGHPTYMFGDRNIAIMGAFRDHVRFTFFNAALLTDPLGLLEKPGKHAQHPSMIRLTSEKQMRDTLGSLRAYLEEAMDYARAGTLPPKTVKEFDIPTELTDALDGNPALAEAFDALTPGRQRGYFMHIGDAKQSATRTARIDRCRPRILAGKGYNER